VLSDLEKSAHAEIGSTAGLDRSTGSRHPLLTSGDERVLWDCGMYQGLQALRLKNWEPFPFRHLPSPHTTHIDHIGMLPRLVKDGFHGAGDLTPPRRILPSCCCWTRHTFRKKTPSI